MLKTESIVPSWSVSPTDILSQLHTSQEGLSGEEARHRLNSYGPNLLRGSTRLSTITLFITQFRSPLVVILLVASILSFFLHDVTDAIIILAIVTASGVLGFWQENGATRAVEKLLAVVKVKTTVLRDSQQIDVPLENVVPGDVVVLKAGNVIPGDCLILESKNLFINEASLTGESFPVEKNSGILPENTPLAQRTNSLFMGTNVISGSCNAVVVRTGTTTEFGKVSERLTPRPRLTEFERGVRRFGYFLMQVTLWLVIAIFVINVYFNRPVLESFLFSLALAVGLTPQLLPAIISINLAYGARQMARYKVIVKRLASIENFGSMDVLCCDKTGTLTEGIARIHGAFDVHGHEHIRTLLYAYINSYYESGFSNPIDEAILHHQQFDTIGYNKLDEVPYDFVRKRVSVLVAREDKKLIITKGALPKVLEICTRTETSEGTIDDITPWRASIQQRVDNLGKQGLRVIGVAYREAGDLTEVNKPDETGMIFLGLVTFFDPPKPGIIEMLQRLKALGISLKIITGDNRLVAAALGQQVGLVNPRIITGQDIHEMTNEALCLRISDIDIFAEVEPNHKEEIILALQKCNHVVGFMGDGINDASALHAADIGISVDCAVDVAKEAADIVLLEDNLGVLIDGVQEGRKTFANTIKYVFMATSANFGNMFSMAGASLFLPFFPLLPKQILLNNLLTDFPETAIARDNVDPEMVAIPRRWDMKFIRSFMLTFGTVHSLMDYATFGFLLFVLHATPEQFRTGWFLESVITSSAIVLIIRTRKPFFRSKPGIYLLLSSLFIIVIAPVFVFSPAGEVFEFQMLPLSFYIAIAGIIGLFIITAEIAKKVFFKRMTL